MKSNRLIEVDILRVVAILAIVISHLGYAVPAFQNNSGFFPIHYFGAICGLCLFFFLSGYSSMIRKPRFDTLYDVRSYLIKRIIRIYPLYWVALLAEFIFMQFINGPYPQFTMLQQLARISGIQILYSSQDGILWFVGVIMVFYFLFPLLIFLVKKMSGSFAHSILEVAVVIFIIMVAIRSTLMLIDIRVFIYYWFFVVGIVLGKGTGIPSIKALAVMKVIFFSGICAVLYLSIRNMPMAFLKPVEQFTPIWLVTGIEFWITGAIGISLAIQFTNSFKRYLTGSIYRLIERIAPSTYPIYLFHTYFLVVVGLPTARFSSVLVPFTVIMIGIPLAILIPPYVQDVADWTVSRLIIGLRQFRRVEKERI